MALLSVTVKKALYVGVQATQYNTYVTLKLQNVKSTTVTVKGPNPCWEQDFLFETNDVNSGLLIEVWSKGMLWDRALGYHWIPLQAVKYSNEVNEFEEGVGQWVSLEGELVMRDGEVVGTKNPTGHSLLLDCRFELPFDPENTEGADLQRKLEMLNSIMDQEARAEQARRQLQYYGHSGYSEDSDYTSDLNYPVGQHANSSASQFRGVANQICTPQRSLETSRENSYERDDAPNRLSPAHPSYRHQQHLAPRSPRQLPDDKYSYASTTAAQAETPARRYSENESEPLFYNSRPRNYKEYTRRARNTWDKEESSEAWYESGYSASYSQEQDDVVDAQSGAYPSYDDAKSRIYAQDDDYYQSQESQDTKHQIGLPEGRRPSLERQATLYDDQYYGEGSYYDQTGMDQQGSYAYDPSQQGYATDYYGAATDYSYQDDRYGQEEEDRQWDSGGYYYQEGYPAGAAAGSAAGAAVVGDQYKNGLNERCSSATLPQTPISAYPPQDTLTKAASIDDPSAYYPVGQLGYDETGGDGYLDDGQYAMPSSASRRRLLLQQKRHSGSRQSSVEDYNYQQSYYDEYPTASTSAPTSTTATASYTTTPMTRKTSHQLPQIPSQSAVAERRNSVKPVGDYAQDESYASYYAAGKDDYNEDYNYAYRSIDNLTPTQDNIEDKAETVDRYARRGLAARQAYKQQSDDYYYSCQDREYSEDLDAGYLDTQPLESTRKKLTRRDNSPLLQQNTDSLESRDDELRDSFETAVSSISSSVHPRNKGYLDYSTAVETTTTITITTATDSQSKAYNNQTDGGYNQTTESYKLAAENYNKQANESYKPLDYNKPSIALSAAAAAAATTTTTSATSTLATPGGYSHATSVTSLSARTRDQDISSTAPPVVSVSVSAPSSNTVTNAVLSFPSQARGYLRTQESLDSCADEVATLNSNAELAKGTLARESPASVLNERYGSSRTHTPVEPYPRTLDNSLNEPYQPSTSKAIMSPSPTQIQKQHSIDESRIGSPSITGSGESQKSQKSKSVSFEDEELQLPVKPVVERRKMTAKERWHWAYNKIIMQLNAIALNRPGEETEVEDRVKRGHKESLEIDIDVNSKDDSSRSKSDSSESKCSKSRSSRDSSESTEESCESESTEESCESESTEESCESKSTKESCESESTEESCESESTEESCESDSTEESCESESTEESCDSKSDRNSDSHDKSCSSDSRHHKKHHHRKHHRHHSRSDSDSDDSLDSDEKIKIRFD